MSSKVYRRLFPHWPTGNQKAPQHHCTSAIRNRTYYERNISAKHRLCHRPSHRPASFSALIPTPRRNGTIGHNNRPGPLIQQGEYHTNRKRATLVCPDRSATASTSTSSVPTYTDISISGTGCSIAASQ